MRFHELEFILILNLILTPRLPGIANLNDATFMFQNLL